MISLTLTLDMKWNMAVEHALWLAMDVFYVRLEPKQYYAYYTLLYLTPCAYTQYYNALDRNVLGLRGKVITHWAWEAHPNSLIFLGHTQ